MGNVLVLAERRSGEVKRPTLEAISVARRLADSLGGRVDVLALGPGASAAADLVARHGADRLLAAEAAHVDLYAPEAYAATLADAAKASNAVVVLAPGTIQGRDVAARAAARLGSACLSDVVEIDVDAAGTLRGKRPVFSGKAYATATIPRARPAFATLRPNVFPLSSPDPSRKAEVVAFPVAIPVEKLRVRTVRLEVPTAQEMDVAEAGII